ncbi:hypothetical protein Vretimale_5187 [Volvox reticuliferus]|uniref:Uncharacterized protein n=1 Tax=Volvox reticuliferus TaxID=1737510 RepID=A0A8J4G5H0_9CHLO|nr:hypothetical protein Vretimale_5187 [Volvox reticuliferus]
MAPCALAATKPKSYSFRFFIVTSVSCCCAASRPNVAGPSIVLFGSKPSRCSYQTRKPSPLASTAYPITGPTFTSYRRSTSVRRRCLGGARWPLFDPVCSTSLLVGTTPPSPPICSRLLGASNERFSVGSLAAAMTTASSGTIQLATADETRGEAAAAASNGAAAVAPDPYCHASSQAIVAAAAGETSNWGSGAVASSEIMSADAGASSFPAQPDDNADHLKQTCDSDPRGKPNPKSKSKSNPRLAKMENSDELEELLVGVYDNEEELVAKLMQQLQGLSHKQQRLYGIWDGTPDGGKRAFVEQWRRRHSERRAMVEGMRDPARAPTERMALRTSYILRFAKGSCG